MTKNIEAYIQQQKQDLADFKRLAKENPDEAYDASRDDEDAWEDYE